MLPDKVIEIGKLLRSRREVLKITQEQLSSVSRVALRTIREIEQGTGNPSLDTMINLFEPLGLEIDIHVKRKGGLPTLGLDY
jgi:putative transcriptional regulator